MRALLFIGLLLGAVSAAHAAVDSSRYVGRESDLTPDERAQYHQLSGTDAQTYLNTRGYYHRCMRVKGVETPKVELKNLKIRPAPFGFDLLDENEQGAYNEVMSDWIQLRLTNVA